MPKARLFFIETFLISENVSTLGVPVRAHLDGVIDGYLARFNTNQDILLLAQTIEAVAVANPKLNFFAYINPANEKLLQALSSNQARVEMLRPFLSFNHRYSDLIQSDNAETHYNKALSLWKKLVPLDVYVAEIRKLMEINFNNQTLDRNFDFSLRKLLDEYLSSAKSVGNDYQSFFTEGFFESTVYLALKHTNNSEYELFLEKIKLLDKSLSAKMVLMDFRASPNLLNDFATTSNLSERFLVGVGGKDQPFLKELLYDIRNNSDSSRNTLNILRLKYHFETAPNPYPIDPHVKIPNTGTALKCAGALGSK
jgi:hypothetical protein